MMIKTVNFVVQQTNGTGMPNFNPKSEYLGMDWGQNQAPGSPFIAGSQEDIRPYAYEQGWLTLNPNQTTPYTRNKSETRRISCKY